MYTDITERKRREQELERQNERLDQFASIVSHDIRNPLNVAQGFLDVARENPNAEYFDRAETALDRVDAIVESVLSLARHGQTVTDPRPTNLASVAEKAWLNVDTKDATLTVESSADRELSGDSTRLSTLFENLFRNAIDHVGTDVSVTVGILDDESGFFIEDDGPGIPPEDRERIFESGFTTRVEGTGYGLAIVKEIVDAHDWTINVAAAADTAEVTDAEPDADSVTTPDADAGEDTESGAGARFEVRNVHWVDEADSRETRESTDQSSA